MEQWIFPLSASFFESPVVMAESCLPERAVLESSGLFPWSCLQRRVLRRLVAPRRMWDDDNAPFLRSLLSQIKLIDWGNRGESANFAVWWQCWGFKPLPLLGFAPCRPHQCLTELGSAFQHSFFLSFLLIWRKRAWGSGVLVGIGVDLWWTALLSAALGWKGVTGTVGNRSEGWRGLSIRGARAVE